jgi:hypothetical protein
LVADDTSLPCTTDKIALPGCRRGDALHVFSDPSKVATNSLERVFDSIGGGMTGDRTASWCFEGLVVKEIESMDQFALSSAPPRRNVKLLTAMVAELCEGEPVAATVRSERYGMVVIEGLVVRSGSSKSLMVGGYGLEAAGRPDADLLALNKIDEVGEVSGATQVVESLAHGDLVKATFEVVPYGRFTITGVAVETVDAQFVSVSNWFLRQRGSVGVRLAALEVLATKGEHAVTVPVRIAEPLGTN